MPKMKKLLLIGIVVFLFEFSVARADEIFYPDPEPATISEPESFSPFSTVRCNQQENLGKCLMILGDLVDEKIDESTFAPTQSMMKLVGKTMSPFLEKVPHFDQKILDETESQKIIVRDETEKYIEYKIADKTRKSRKQLEVVQEEILKLKNMLENLLEKWEVWNTDCAAEMDREISEFEKKLDENSLKKAWQENFPDQYKNMTDAFETVKSDFKKEEAKTDPYSQKFCNTNLYTLLKNAEEQFKILQTQSEDDAQDVVFLANNLEEKIEKITKILDDFEKKLNGTKTTQFKELNENIPEIKKPFQENLKTHQTEQKKLQDELNANPGFFFSTGKCKNNCPQTDCDETTVEFDWEGDLDACLAECEQMCDFTHTIKMEDGTYTEAREKFQEIDAKADELLFSAEILSPEFEATLKQSMVAEIMKDENFQEAESLYPDAQNLDIKGTGYFQNAVEKMSTQNVNTAQTFSNAVQNYDQILELYEMAQQRFRIPPVRNGGILPGPEREYSGTRYVQEKLIPKFVNGLIIFLFGISVLMIIVGGVMYVTSSADSEVTTKAKDIILWSLGGTVIAVTAFALVKIITGINFYG
jgi:hypothetical protein